MNPIPATSSATISATPPTQGDLTRSPTSNDDDLSQPPKKRQKRNKPTLSCEECVERKTKCDRGRPTCLACIKRQSECKYADIANILEETNRSINNVKRAPKAPKPTYPIKNGVEVSRQIPSQHERSASRGSVSSSTGLLSNVPYSHPSASNVFGIGSEHPFENYWTRQGGLAEVINVMPDKVQADILLERYFECVDPVYPMLHRQTFYSDYELFCNLERADKDKANGALVALIFAMLAMGTQFVTTFSPKEGQQFAEFYVSAAHQALRISSYLNKTSVRSIQAMVLVTYFLINDNHASDGWAFAGILIRQAYAMGLHRDPNIVVPNATSFEKQSRRKLWQAVLLQDTFLTVLLSLPPSATHTDVSVTSLTHDEDSSPTDTAYITLSWRLATLVQHSICTPRSLDLPLHQTPFAKARLLQKFNAIHSSFPASFLTLSLSPINPSPNSNHGTAQVSNPLRVLRQTLFLTSNYHHNIMLLHSSSSPQVPINIPGALGAAHSAIGAFFKLWEVFRAESKVWWVFNHRAFLEALCIGGILRGEGQIEEGEGGEKEQEENDRLAENDPLFIRGRADIVRMIEIMREMSEGEHGSKVALTRVSVLSAYI